MANQDEILELKFEGGGINPDAVKASEIAELITSFERAVLLSLHEKFPDIDTTKYAFLSISKIEDQSLGLKFSAKRATDAFVAAYLAITASVNDNVYNDLPYPAIESLNNILRFTKRHNCECNYIYKGERLAQFTPTTVVEISEKNTLRGETVIYGQIQRVGGATPRVVFKDHTGQSIYFEVSEENAKKLASKLYEEVALSGTARWDKKSYKIVDFTVSGITDLQNTSLTETFSQIRSIIGKYWDEVDDIESVLN